jgi:hypothetical protein
MIDSLSSLTALLMILLAAYGVGQAVVERMRYDRHEPLSATMWSLCLGLVLCGSLLVALGLAGLLYRPLIGVLTCSAALVGVGSIVRQTAQIVPRRLPGAARSQSITPSEPAYGPWAETIAAGASDPPRWLLGIAAVLSSMVCLGSLVAALAPSTDGDALCYHLDLPKMFLQQHSLYLPEYSDHGTFPLLVEMWYLWAMAIDGGVAAQLMHWALGMLLALAGVLLARDVLGAGWSWLVAPLVLVTPGISNQMAAPLNDGGLALWCIMALLAWRRAARDEDQANWFAAAGAMLGAAASTKYTALLFAAAIAAFAVWQIWKFPQRRPWLLKGAAIGCIAAGCIAAPWYARAAWHRGNPVYPFFSQHLGQPAPDVLPERKTPHTWQLASLASMPWELTMRPERFGGRGHQLGAIFLVALPGLAFARRLRGLGELLAVAAVYFALWYELRQNLRFLYPIIPILAVGVVWVWIEVGRFPTAARWIARSAFGMLALFGALLPLWRSADRLYVAMGVESREHYLLAQEPSYAAAMTANALLPAGARLLSQDYRSYYFDREVVRESVFRRQTRYEQQLQQPTDLSKRLLDDGFTHLLLAEASGPGIRFNARLARLVAAQQAIEPRRFRTLIDYQIVDFDGALRRYQLLEIRP